MSLVAALIYWVIVALWFAILCATVIAYGRNPKTFGTTRLLLAVVAIDTCRNLAENLYFGLYFGGQYGVFPRALVDVLGQPYLLILPKLANVAAASVVLSLLVLRWLPLAAKERLRVDAEMLLKSKELRQEIEEQRHLFETSLDLILMLDRDGVVRRVSNSSLQILGYRPEELVGLGADVYAWPGDVPRIRTAFTELPEREAIRVFEADFLHRQGHLVSLAFTAVWSEESQRMFVIGRDMTERRAAEAKLEYLAHFDQLTGLPNRVSFLRDLQGHLHGADAGTARRAVAPVAVAVFDLDSFKDINDLLGHATGDRVVALIAERLKSLSPEVGQFYRLGGDEFFLIIPGCREAGEMVRITRTVLKRVEERLDVDGYRLFVRARAGLALAPQHGSVPDELIQSADLALYQAKAVGGFSVFEPSMRVRARARQEIENDLRRACSRNEFVLAYQPQIRLSDGAVVGAEALLRWNHPDRGLLQPADFIDALVRSPAALEAGNFVLHDACRAAASWRAKGLSLRIGVNLFPVQFHSGALLAEVDAALGQSGLPAEALELEITENTAFGHGEEILQALQALRARGISIAFDDFGTGYASLSYLMRYPLSRLKIDRSFVQKITDTSHAEDTAIVHSIIVMAHNIGLAVVAEGVETEVQANFLRARRCEEAQGYLFARPLPLAEFEALVLADAAQRRVGVR